jgi:hypothetical protein
MINGTVKTGEAIHCQQTVKCGRVRARIALLLHATDDYMQKSGRIPHVISDGLAELVIHVTPTIPSILILVLSFRTID